jgi:hypothetical protein
VYQNRHLRCVKISPRRQPVAVTGYPDEPPAGVPPNSGIITGMRKWDLRGPYHHTKKLRFAFDDQIMHPMKKGWCGSGSAAGGIGRTDPFMICDIHLVWSPSSLFRCQQHNPFPGRGWHQTTFASILFLTCCDPSLSHQLFLLLPFILATDQHVGSVSRTRDLYGVFTC